MNEGFKFLEKNNAYLVQKVWNALFKGYIEEAFSLFANDAMLSWGPYNFNGLTEIKNWGLELKKNFGELKLIENKIDVKGEKTVQKFVIELSMPNGFRGTLPGIAEYTFKKGKIKRAMINILPGVAFIKRKNIALHISKFQLNLMKTSR